MTAPSIEFKHRRILLKLSGEALLDESGAPFSAGFLAYVAGEIAELHRLGGQLALVLGGGNIFRGLGGTAQGVDRISGDYMGMLATLINCLALAPFLRRLGVPCTVLSPFPVHQVSEPISANALRRVLDAGAVALCAGGTGNPFFTTDSAAVLRALEAGCDVVVKATKVDGIYDRDPVKHPDAVLLPRLTFEEAVRRRLGVMDQAAFDLCQENRLPIIVLNAFVAGNLLRAMRGDAVGSLVSD